MEVHLNVEQFKYGLISATHIMSILDTTISYRDY